MKSSLRLVLKEQIVDYAKKHSHGDKDKTDTVASNIRPPLDNLNKIYYNHTEDNCLKVPTIQNNLLFKNEPLKIIVIIALMSLTLSLLAGLPSASGVYALPSRGSGGQLGAGTLSGTHPNGGGPLSGLNPPANCGGPDLLFPTTSTNCAGPNVLHPTHAPNTTVIQPANCNVPSAVRHTSAPSTTVVHPTNCPPPTSVSSNSLTINNAQSSNSAGTTEQSTNAGIFDYLTAESSQNNIIPIANAGPNLIVYSYNYVTLDGSQSYDPNGSPLNFSWEQLAGEPVVGVSNYNAANPIVIALAYPTTLTFQLVVNNGQAYSNPAYVYVLVEPKLTTYQLY
jgi:hypothetical protein